MLSQTILQYSYFLQFKIKKNTKLYANTTNLLKINKWLKSAGNFAYKRLKSRLTHFVH